MSGAHWACKSAGQQTRPQLGKGAAPMHWAVTGSRLSKWPKPKLSSRQRRSSTHQDRQSENLPSIADITIWQNPRRCQTEKCVVVLGKLSLQIEATSTV